VADTAGRVVEQAPAKLNLDLIVTGRTAAGYHELDSIVVFAPVADRLTFRHAAGQSLAIEGPFADALTAAPDNLVLRAAALLAQSAGRRPEAAITLEKNLPVASGIGGGSADAAATLRGLARLWGLGWPDHRLRELALPLGADVPVCVYARPARLRGIGERLDPIRGLPDLPLLLVNPGVPLPTRAVFAAFEMPSDAFARPRLPPQPSLTRFAVWLAASRNELQSAAIGVAPVIATALAALEACPGCLLARMSGSGATCFGLFADLAAATAAAAAIGEAQPGWWCRPCLVPGNLG